MAQGENIRPFLALKKKKEILQLPTGQDDRVCRWYVDINHTVYIRCRSDIAQKIHCVNIAKMGWSFI